ncbi:hypothetical protein L228DRAFT_267312 [Xylona heveae TC161]|uniref:Uncharacterized protein n=1 Tax=Xylona heveae (strain CBS 132557 / TC161) TaxID=1328760 RepID=A0A165HCK7_XYLHT|nr:hypothetical protein L228DRAFT_267312 [Xylona heveae TC161]KZF23303.1 hypothetical protein L228DRAFT_267312 [Xylona heveae TC161]
MSFPSSTASSTTIDSIMNQSQETNDPSFTSLKDEHEDLASIRMSEEDGFLTGKTLYRSSQSRPMHRYVLWIKYLLVALVWIASIAAAVYISRQKSREHYGLADIFDTELYPVQSAIEVQKVRFLGNLEFDENGTLIETLWDSNAPRYTGEPSDELDARWKSLFRVDGVDLRGVEAETIRGKTYEKPGGWSIVGIDVFHQLHCLNMLRQGLRRDYYTKHDPEPAYTVHLSDTPQNHRG